jgi:2-dehydropantoate 2-reductase
MDIVVLGAGGIGSTCAAFLARGGHDVRLVARGDHLRVVRKQGLRVSGLAEFTVDLDAVERASGACDVFVLATKTPDTLAALERVSELRPAVAFSMQNGVLKNAQLADAFGDGPVLGAATMVAASRPRPGAVAYTLDGVTAVGELAGGRSQRVEELAAAWNDSGLKMAAVEDISGHEWAKQALQAGAAPLAALTHQPSHLIWGTPPLARTLVLMVREAASVAAALGVELSTSESYGFDMRAVANEPLEAAIARVIARGEELVATGRTSVILSMDQDMRAGKPTEIEETVGHVVAEADRLGVDVPMLRMACEVIRGIELACGVRSSSAAVGDHV